MMANVRHYSPKLFFQLSSKSGNRTMANVRRVGENKRSENSSRRWVTHYLRDDPIDLFYELFCKQHDVRGLLG